MSAIPASTEPAKNKGQKKRERLIQAAQEEIHKLGYSATSLAKIASAANVPLGNVYYYFKTKDDLVRAVIDQHVESVESLIEEANAADTPLARLVRFVDLLEQSAEAIAGHGCPLGCLGQDLNKAGDQFIEDGKRLFSRQLDWFEEQFRLAGMGSEAQDLAIHMLARSQGASAVCHTSGDPAVMTRELGRLRDWLRQTL